MESESTVQLSLRRNRMKCLDLNYPKIASLLISNDILPEVQHKKFKNASADSVGKMDALLSFLHELNSLQAFNLFRDGVIICGELDLAESLRTDDSMSSLAAVPVVQVEPKIDCLLMPKILSKVFSYLPKNELLNARRVCETWNGVVIQFYSSLFTLQLKTQNDSNNLVEFLQIAPNSIFCKAISNFQLSIRTCSEVEKGFWKTILERFGNNIQSLTLSKLDKDVVELIFSKDIQKFLENLTQFHLNVSLEVSFVGKTSLSFLLQLKHLTITATGDKSEDGQIEFLSKFLRLEHKLHSLVLVGHFCIGQLPSDILPNLFRTNSIELLHVSLQLSYFLVDEHYKSITIKNTLSRLKDIKFDGMDVTPIIFHQFLVSHRRTLKRISISISNEMLLNHFPTLDCLTHLEVSIIMTSDSNGWSFCTQFSNLKELRLKVMNEFDVGRFISFEHKALRSLYLNLSGARLNSIISLIAKIPSFFSNLAMLEIRHDPAHILHRQFVGNLHHQIREHGKSVWTSTSNGIL